MSGCEQPRRSAAVHPGEEKLFLMVEPAFISSSYRLSIYAIPHLVVAACVFGLGIFVMVRERPSRVGYIYPLTRLTLGMYMLSSGMTYMAVDSGSSVPWIRAASISTSFIPWAELLLATSILGVTIKYRRAIHAAFGAGLIFAVSIIGTQLFQSSIPRAFAWGYFAWFKPLALIFIVYFVVTCIFILKLYLRAYRDAEDERTKNRLLAILVSVICGFTASFDFLPGFGVNVYPIGFIPIACYTTGMAYVIVRYHLVDITPELATNQILETMQSAVIVVDQNGDIRVANRAAQDMLGYPHSTIRGSRLSSLLNIHAATDFSKENIKNTCTEEMVWPGGDGRQIQVRVTASPLFEQKHGYRLGTVYVAHDITARKEMEWKISAIAAEWTQTFDAITDCIMILDPEQRIVRCNKATRDLLGIPYQQILGRRCWELIHYSHGPADGCPTLRMLKSGKRETMILTMQDRTNLVTAEPVLDERGGVRQIIHTISNITEQTKLEAKLREAKTLEAVGRLASGVAHEVRNPLNAILSISEALFSEPEIKGNDEYAPYIQHIRSQVKRLSDLMKDLLELGRPVSQANLVTVPLQNVCQDALHLWKATETAKEHPICVSYEFQSGGPLVLADSTRLQQALINLLDNAAQNSPSGSKIDMKIEKQDGHSVVIKVRDCGSGIPPEKIALIFNPFFTTRKGGTGLGLSIVKHNLENMGGVISIKNNEDQPGCTAEVKLPIEKESTA